MGNERITLATKCKKCGMYYEDHVGFWKVTNCKFEPDYSGKDGDQNG